MFKQKSIVLMITFFVCLLLGTGIAFSFPVDLTYPNESGMPIMPYATVDGWVDGADNSIFHFKVDLAPGLYGALNGSNNFGMDKFYFNTNLITPLTIMNWNPNVWDFTNYGQSADGFGTYTVELKDVGKNNRHDHLYFDVDYTSTVTEDNFFLLFLIVYRSISVWVGYWLPPSPPLITGTALMSAANCAAPSFGWRTTSTFA